MKRRFAPRQQPVVKTARAAAPAKAAPKSASAKPTVAGLPRYLSPAPAKKPDLARQPTLVREALQQPGQPLDAATRKTMERRFRRELSAVRVHTTPTAAKSAQALQAHAYTLGQHIVFGPGRYSPHSPEGRCLLTHELAHVAQQNQPGAPASSRRLETEADRHAASAEPVHALSAAPLQIQRKAIESTQTTAPNPGDHFAIDLGGPNFWFVFYDGSFKAVKKLVGPDKKDTGQIGPNWVCNNPGNMTYDPTKIGKKNEPNIAVLSKIDRDNGAFPDPFSRTGIPLAVFPSMEKGRAALKAWYTALLTPTHPYWAELGVTRKDQTLAGAIGEHAPKGHGGNDPGEYARIVTGAINRSRESENANQRELPYLGSPQTRGQLNANAVTTVDPAGTGNQTLNARDLEALVDGSETAEGGLLAGYYWEVKESQTLPADLAKKLGKIPPALAAWCSAHAVTIP